MNTVPINDYDHLKIDNEKLLVENEMLKDYDILESEITGNLLNTKTLINWEWFTLKTIIWITRVRNVLKIIKGDWID